MRNKTLALAFVLYLLVAVMSVVPNAHAGTKQTITLAALDGGNASGSVVVTPANRGATLTLTVSGLTPNAVHSLWQLMDVASTPFVVDPVLGLAVVTDHNLGTLSSVIPVSPVSADNAGYKGGTGLDPNGFVTDSKGTATVTIKLNYDITMLGTAPVVLAPQTQTVQVEPATGLGPCTASAGSVFQSLIDSGYARQYDTSQSAPSFQLKDGKYRAKLIRGTTVNLIVVEHLDGLTHGHLPGVMADVIGCGDHLGKLIGVVAH
ncbi:MAG TPA: hypothetical protein VFA68_11305 [Terriglobales bacterium]|nr:hypothetical protein [Terriglobales bacterium]